jgi:chromosome segregation ATPase
VLLSPADIATIRSSIRPQPAASAPAADPEAADRPDERDRTIKALEGEATALREALARERERADKAEATAGPALVDLAAERTRAAVAEAKLEAAEAALAEVRNALVESRRLLWHRWF